MFSETIEVNITYGSTATFFLRMLSVAEENEFRARVFGIDEKEKTEKEYGANVALLAELSIKKPIGLIPESPKVTSADDQTKYAESFKSAADLIKEFFAEKTVVKERIAFYAVRTYFTRLLPSESFF